MVKKSLFIIILCVLGIALFARYVNPTPSTPLSFSEEEQQEIVDQGEAPKAELHPLSIEYLKNGEYTGSDLVIEQTLAPGVNYSRYIVSYKSEGLKQFALLTVPVGEKPETGWPVVVFNHGFIPPTQYRTTERYIAYTDAFSRNGYILLRPDYRGHGNSEGDAEGGYGSNAYTIDVLNAVASIKKYPDADATKIGMWGHSMGGPVTLENMVAFGDVKAGVIWAGVVGSYEELFSNWRRRNTNQNAQNPNSITPSTRGGGWRKELSEQYGEPKDNPEFWNSLSATSYLTDISGPVQLHHGTNDTSVPMQFSVDLNSRLKDLNKEVELYIYDGDDHNLSQNLTIALNRSVEFFDKYLK